LTEIESIIAAVNRAEPIYLYFTLFFFAFIENLFPPSPSDLFIAFGGALVGLGKLNIFLTITFATVGSTAGFVLMYYIGFFLGKKLVDSRKLKIIPFDKIKKVEDWFLKYGYWIVVGNRFMSGTRAVISFFVGLSELPIVVTLPLCAVSALLWNSLLVFFGSQLGHNWRIVGYYLDIYYKIVIAIIVLLTGTYLVWKFFSRRKHA
jgi:membrane protein DedA with SNARE-associated domain